MSDPISTCLPLTCKLSSEAHQGRVSKEGLTCGRRDPVISLPVPVKLQVPKETFGLREWTDVDNSKAKVSVDTVICGGLRLRSHDISPELG
jgi:hypothetical protein